jgi:hypothetical protein
MLAAVPAGAQTHFTFVNGGNVTAFGYEVGQYNGYEKFGTQNQSVILNCVDFFHGVTDGEQWDANLTALTGPIGSNTRNSNITLYKEAAYLATKFTQAGLNSKDIGNIQATIWNLFGNTGITMYSTWQGATYTPSYWLTLAQNNYASMNFTGWYVVTDVNKNLSNSVQEFVMYNPNVQNVSASPEPASLVLMGTGLLSVITLTRRKRKAA